MSNTDLDSKASELKKELMKINAQVATGTTPKSPGKVKDIRRTIAKIFTIKKEKEQNKEVQKQKGGSKKDA